MIKRFIIALGIISVLIYLSVQYLPILMGYKSGKPKIEIPITYKIGWWSNQNAVTVTDFNVEVIKSKLGLFNSSSIIRYHIEGKLSLPREGWEPYIGEVHVSERNLQLNSMGNIATDESLSSETKKWGSSNPKAIIELTPIVDTKKNESYEGSTIIDFSFKNEHKVHSLWWGKNYYLIKCGDFEKVIVLEQKK